MPNLIDATGLTIKTRAEIVAVLTAGLKSIYGDDINLDPNTPDGNWVQIMAQVAADQCEFIAQVNAMFDPDQAIGRNLDRDCAYNGVFRKAGTRTTQLVTVTVTQAVSLAGLDTAPDAPFTISDATGNRFNLVTTHAFGGAGAANLTFQAEKIGAVVVIANTLTNIVTVTLGVASVTNGVLAGVTGTNEESDANLRLRRQNSVELPSQGFIDGLYGAILDLEGVTSVLILENDTASTDGNGIPSHSIWCVVAGGTNADIAEAIFKKRNAGCGMKGAVIVNVVQVDGGVTIIKFDRPTAENLYISFSLAALSGVADPVYVRNQLLAQLQYIIGAPADASEIVALIKQIAPNCYITACGVSSDGISYVEFLNTATVDKQWATAAVRIIINGTPG